jgi:hypothetical protein
LSPSGAAVHAPRALPVVALIGGAAIALGALLSWFDAGPAGASNSFDVALLYLFQYDTTSSGIRLGVLLLGLAVAAVVGGLSPSLPWLRRAAGFGAIAAVVLFVVQTHRLLSSFDGGSVFSNLGVGVWITLGAGLLLLFEGKVNRLFREDDRTGGHRSRYLGRPPGLNRDSALRHRTSRHGAR